MLRLGVDVGGTFIKAGVVDETYSILQKVSVPTGGDAGYEAVVKNIVYAAQLAADQAGRTVKDFASVGIGGHPKAAAGPRVRGQRCQLRRGGGDPGRRG